jgi:hypothetical protein
LLFIERAIDTLLKRDGWFGMIVPNPWLTNITQTKTRSYVFSNTTIRQIVHFTFSVFARAKAIVDTEIVIFSKERKKKNPILAHIVSSVGVDGTIDIRSARNIVLDQEDWVGGAGAPVNIFLDARHRELAKKIRSSGQPLGMLFKINVGMKPYQVGKGTPKQIRADVKNRVFDSERQVTAEYVRYIRGTDFGRFIVSPVEERYIRFGPWLAEPRPAARFDAPIKIIMRQTGDSLIAAVDRRQFVCMNNIHVLVPNGPEQDVNYCVGVINSRLMNWYYQSLNPEMGEALAEVKKTNVELLPIPKGSVGDVARISGLSQQIERGLSDLREANDESTRAMRKRVLDTLYDQLNEAVDQLFKLTPTEREMINVSQAGITLG